MSTENIQVRIHTLEAELDELRPLQNELSKLKRKITALETKLKSRDQEIKELQEVFLESEQPSTSDTREIVCIKCKEGASADHWNVFPGKSDGSMQTLPNADSAGAGESVVDRRAEDDNRSTLSEQAQAGTSSAVRTLDRELSDNQQTGPRRRSSASEPDADSNSLETQHRDKRQRCDETHSSSDMTLEERIDELEHEASLLYATSPVSERGSMRSMQAEPGTFCIAEGASEQSDISREQREMVLSLKLPPGFTEDIYPIDIIYNRICHLNLAEQPLDVPSHILDPTFTRKELRLACGGNSRSIVVKVKSRDKIARHGFKQFMCISLKFHPHGPQIPGRSGIYFALRKEDLWPRKEELVITRYGENKWNVMGIYECKMERPLSREEFRRLSKDARNTWINIAYKSGSGIFTRAAIFLRETLIREPTKEEVLAETWEETSDTESDAECVDLDAIRSAFMEGEETINVFSMKFSRYDEKVIAFKRLILDFQEMGEARNAVMSSDDAENYTGSRLPPRRLARTRVDTRTEPGSSRLATQSTGGVVEAPRLFSGRYTRQQARNIQRSNPRNVIETSDSSGNPENEEDVDMPDFNEVE